MRYTGAMTNTTETRTYADIPDGSDAMVGAALCADYYGGQFTAMYALISAGSLELYSGEGTDRLVRELGEAITTAEIAGEWGDAEALSALREWVLAG